MLEIEKYCREINSLEKKVKPFLESLNIGYDIPNDQNDTVKIVFAGQYNAGKSSTIQMMTGINDIAIGGGITTQQTHEYDWNGLKIIDTPGIHTKLRPDHDEIAYAEIAAADILVFMITYQLFDNHMGNHFRKLAIDKDKAHEMILVINKMEDTALGNTPEQQEILKNSTGFIDVIKPYSCEDLNTCFIDVNKYLESIEEREADPELAKETYELSGYENFINTLNKFVDEKGIASKLTTKLYLIIDKLEEAIKITQPQSEDADIDALEENLLQQRHILSDRKNKIEQDVRDIYTVASSKIRNLGLEASNLLDKGCEQDVVESQLQEYIEKVQAIAEKCENDAQKAIETGLDDIDKDFERMEKADFSQILSARLIQKYDILPDSIKNILNSVSSGAKDVSNLIAQNAFNKSVQCGGLKLTNFSGSNIHNLVLKIGKGLGYKFKPWQAIKITKGVAIGGQIFSALGIAFSVFLQIKSQADEEKILEELRINRQNIRSQFNDVASDLFDSGKDIIANNVTLPLDSSINEIGKHIQAIRDTRNNRNETCLKLEQLKSECLALINKIHQS